MSETDEVGEACPVIEFDHAVVKPAFTYFELYDELRERFPFFRSSYGNSFLCLTRYDLIYEALRDPGLFSSASGMIHNPDPPIQWIPVNLDPPVHTTWRQLISPAFSPKRIAALDSQIRQRCVHLIEGLVADGSCDFVESFGKKFPTSIFIELLGMPQSDLDLFLGWVKRILHAGTDPESAGDQMMAMGEVIGYFQTLMEYKRREPGADLVSESMHWEIDGAPIPPEQLLSFYLLMFMAGLDTVSDELGYVFHHLATHEGDRRRLMDEPALLPLAIEEFLRIYPIVPDARKVTRDQDFHGCPLHAGDMVFLPLSAACRDPRAFDRADEFVIDRPNNHHIAFGAGPHRCVGAALARRELTVAVEEWHARIPDYRVAPGAELFETGTMIGLTTLPLEWG